MNYSCQEEFGDPLSEGAPSRPHHLQTRANFPASGIRPNLEKKRILNAYKYWKKLSLKTRANSPASEIRPNLDKK